MRKESKSILLFLLIEVITMLTISYVDSLGYWITDLVGTALVLTIGTASYNLVFLVPMAIGVVICALGLITRNIYLDYTILGVGAGFIAAAAIQLFPLLLSLV